MEEILEGLELLGPTTMIIAVGIATVFLVIVAVYVWFATNGTGEEQKSAVNVEAENNNSKELQSSFNVFVIRVSVGIFFIVSGLLALQFSTQWLTIDSVLTGLPGVLLMLLGTLVVINAAWKRNVDNQNRG